MKPSSKRHLRKMWKAKVALWILISIGFLFVFACAANTPNAAGKINGKTITAEEFYSAYRGHFAMFSYEKGRSPDKDEKLKLWNETWTNITRAIILKDYYQKYKINSTPKEVLDTLSTSIPQHITKSQRFQTNSKFDKALYLQSLLTDRPENLSALRKHYQEYVIPSQKLQARLIEKELISKKRERTIQRILSSNADIILHIFDAQDLSVLISDSEVSAFYQANLNRFRLQPYYKLAFAIVHVKPDPDDLDYAKAVADSLWEQLNSGYTYDEIAKTKKTLTAAVSMTDHGYIKTIELPQEVSDLLIPLMDGACSRPVKSEKGWVIYQKVQSTKTLTQYRSIYIQSMPRTASMIAPEASARRMMTLALDIGLELAADEFDHTYFVGERVHPDSLVLPAKDITAQLNKRLKVAKSGSIIEPLYSSELSAYVVCEVLENQNQEFSSQLEVSSIIRNELSLQRKQDLNLQKAQQWLKDTSASTPTKVLQLTDVNGETQLQNYPFANIFFQGVSAYLEKREAPLIIHQDIIFVPRVVSLKSTSKPVTTAQIRAAYSNSLPQNWFDTWLDEQVAKAKITKNIAP